MSASHTNQNINDNDPNEPTAPQLPLQRQFTLDHYLRFFHINQEGARNRYNADNNQALTANEFKAIIGVTQTSNSGPSQ